MPLPSFVIPPSSNTAFIILPTSILVLSLSTTEPSYEEAITLKNSATNAFLGIGLSNSPTTSERTEVVVISKGSGVLTVAVELKGSLEGAGECVRSTCCKRRDLSVLTSSISLRASQPRIDGDCAPQVED